MEYHATYKCRLCGAKFTQGVTGKEKAIAHITELTVGLRSVSLPLICETVPHNCVGNHAGSLGMADFLGWEKGE